MADVVGELEGDEAHGLYSSLVDYGKGLLPWTCGFWETVEADLTSQWRG
ncbi:MAG: hypothetical protein AAF773_12585 [Cyanobacteria bacterium P01_D01_bin.115]